LTQTKSPLRLSLIGLPLSRVSSSASSSMCSAIRSASLFISRPRSRASSFRRSPLVDRSRRHRHVGFEVAGKAAGGPGDAYGRDGLVEQVDAREFDQPEIERLGHAREVIIPLEDLAELKAGVELPAALAETVEMAAHKVQPLFEPRVGPGLACSCPPVELSEEERIGQRSAADRDRRAACLLEHRGRVGNGPYVAVGHDWNSFHGLDHGTYAMPVHGT